MERQEAAEVEVYLDRAPLRRGLADLRDEVQSAFDAMGRAASGRFEVRTESVTRAMADWSRQASALKSQFEALGATVGSTFAVAMTPAIGAMNSFMSAVVNTANTFRSFVFSLFGKNYGEKAAGALDTVGSSAAGAGRKVSGAARQVRRSLMAFDQINRLDMASGSGSGRSSGGSRSVTAEMEELIEGNLFGEMLRALILDRRYFEAGQALAQKVGEIVDGLDAALTAERFQTKLRNALGAVTEGINGFFTGLTFSETDRQSVAFRIGDFIGDAVGLGLEAIHATLAGVGWGRIGTAIAQFVNGGIASLREKDCNLGAVLAAWLNAKLGTLDGLFGELDWSGVGAYIAENVNAWFEDIDWTLVGRTLRDGILGLKDMVVTALRDIDIDWSEIVGELETGLVDDELADWFRAHPFWSRLAFGADTPFTAEITAVSDGVPKRKKNLSDFTARLAAWAEAFVGRSAEKALGFEAKLTSWREALAGKTLAFQAKLTGWKEALTGKVLAFQAKLTSWKEALADKVLAFQAKLTSWSDALKSKSISFSAQLTTWVDALKNKTITFSASISGIVGNLSSKLKTALGLKADGGVFAGGRWSPIQRYAAGGAPGTGQLFVAREAGPELVGTLGGHTAVMNNDQIVASVSAGVARAMTGLRFYSREQATPRLAVIGQSVSRSERRLDRIAQRADAGEIGENPEAVALLREIVRLMRSQERDVYLDGVSVKDRIVSLINQNTRATGVCEIIV